MPVIYLDEHQDRVPRTVTYLLSNFLHMSDYEVVALGMVEYGETPGVLEGDEM